MLCSKIIRLIVIGIIKVPGITYNISACYSSYPYIKLEIHLQLRSIFLYSQIHT